jgi:hypothetical protein
MGVWFCDPQPNLRKLLNPHASKNPALLLEIEVIISSASEPPYNVRIPGEW